MYIGSQLSYTEKLVPVGTILAHAGTVDEEHRLPATWLVCRGQEIGASEYGELAGVLGSSWGKASPGKVKLPDLRGLFLRGINLESGQNPDGVQVGKIQEDMLASHDHDVNDPGHVHPGVVRSSGIAKSGTDGGGNHDWNASTGSGKTNITIAPRGGKETRPKNASVTWIIRVK